MVWRKCVVMGILLLGFAMPVDAAPTHRDGDPVIIARAETYLTAYQSLDLPALASLLAADARFDDPTSTEMQAVGGPFVWEGREAVLAGLAGWVRQSVRRIDYDLREVYEASGRVVFIGTASPLMQTADGLIRATYPIVTIVTVRDGHIVEHRDYTNYAGARMAKAS
jgi:ketosteroid isomerase-like protein